jgi:hypothetical protein
MKEKPGMAGHPGDFESLKGHAASESMYSPNAQEVPWWDLCEQAPIFPRVSVLERSTDFLVRIISKRPEDPLDSDVRAKKNHW